MHTNSVPPPSPLLHPCLPYWTTDKSPQISRQAGRQYSTSPDQQLHDAYRHCGTSRLGGGLYRSRVLAGGGGQYSMQHTGCMLGLHTSRHTAVTCSPLMPLSWHTQHKTGATSPNKTHAPTPPHTLPLPLPPSPDPQATVPSVLLPQAPAPGQQQAWRHQGLPP